MKASIRDLRTSSKLIVNEIERGNEVIMTYHGRDFAKIIPLGKHTKLSKETSSRKKTAFGMWEDNESTKSVNQFIDKIREPRK